MEAAMVGWRGSVEGEWTDGMFVMRDWINEIDEIDDFS